MGTLSTSKDCTGLPEAEGEFLAPLPMVCLLSCECSQPWYSPTAPPAVATMGSYPIAPQKRSLTVTRIPGVASICASQRPALGWMGSQKM